jgi:hypothetical protein
MVDMVPAPLRARQGGHCSMVFASWSIAGEGETNPPDRYHEAFIVMAADVDERKVANVPHSFTDSELAIERDRSLGKPARFGTIDLSIPALPGDSGLRRGAGANLVGHVSVAAQHLVTASVVLETAETYVPPALDRELWNARQSVDNAGGAPLANEVCSPIIESFEMANHWRGDQATLEFAPTENDEIGRFAPIEIIGGWSCSVAYTVTGTRRRPLEG